MKISLKWLNDFIDVAEYKKQPQALADILTRAGLEVEEIKDHAKDFQHVIIGHIRSKDKHPNADKLSLCQVEVANGQIEQIVCGAQNHKSGDKVIVALPGAVLPGNFAIKKSKIRDVESNGMLCSLKELGLAETSDGIEILSESATTGASYAEFYGYDDVSFELKVTPNRADCLSHYGLARELSCLLNKNLKAPVVATEFVKNQSQVKYSVLHQDQELCPRYTGRSIKGVKVGPSPKWLKQRLELLGMNSINNVVDVTNYVMLEMGQPLHAFDADLIKNGQLQIRKAKASEKFKTLKEQDLSLSADDLVIADSDKVLALAGVIGGLESGVSEKTVNIFLESASFNAMSVRKTARKYGIETDSSYRFARGVDRSQALFISDRAAYLIQQVAGGQIDESVFDSYPNPQIKKNIQIDIQTVSQRLGYAVDESRFVQFMHGLQMGLEKLKPGFYQITPPLFRFDIDHAMDLVEEYARLDGYEKIQESIPALACEPSSHDAHYLLQQKVSFVCREEGFYQAFNYAFTNRSYENLFVDSAKYKSVGLVVDNEAVGILNPLSEELNVMRRSLVPGLWRNAVDNIRSGTEWGSLFEIGPVFSKISSGYSEKKHLSFVSWGTSSSVMSVKLDPVVHVKMAIEKLLQFLQINTYTIQQTSEALSFTHKGQFATLFVEGKNVGFFGSLHPKFLNDEKIRVPVAIAEIDFELLIKGQPRPIKYKAVSKFQPVERDFAFVMGSEMQVGDLVKEAKKQCGAMLKELAVFDIYEGDKLAHGQKSVAIRAQFQSTEAALTDADIQNLSQKLINSASQSVGAVLR